MRDREKKCDLLIGQIVKSKAGRDKGEVFIVYDIVDANHVLVVDGRLRKLANPKKKKLKHLQRYNKLIEDFDKLKSNKDFNDAFIRRLIESEIK